jgi:peptidoglycan-associated lipoprotein
MSERARQQEEEIRREEAAAAAVGLNDVFFAFDSWTLSEEHMQTLARNAEWIKANPNARLKIGGHCDERGTQAYNLVLGERRAKTTRNYLAELGVGSNRLAVVSYGKERPFCKENDESCYQQNRRGQMLLGVSKAAKKTSSAVR